MNSFCNNANTGYQNEATRIFREKIIFHLNKNAKNELKIIQMISLIIN